MLGALNRVLVLPPAENAGVEEKTDGAGDAEVAAAADDAVPSSGLLVRPNSEVPPGVDGAVMPEVAIPEPNFGASDLVVAPKRGAPPEVADGNLKPVVGAVVGA